MSTSNDQERVTVSLKTCFLSEDVGEIPECILDEHVGFVVNDVGDCNTLEKNGISTVMGLLRTPESTLGAITNIGGRFFGLMKNAFHGYSLKITYEGRSQIIELKFGMSEEEVRKYRQAFDFMVENLTDGLKHAVTVSFAP